MNYRWQMIKTLQLGLAGEHLDGRARQRLLGSAKGGESLQDNEDKKTAAWFCKDGRGGNLREIMKIKRQIPDPGSSCPLGRQVSFPFGSLPFVLIQFNFNDWWGQGICSLVFNNFILVPGHSFAAAPDDDSDINNQKIYKCSGFYFVRKICIDRITFYMML